MLLLSVNCLPRFFCAYSFFASLVDAWFCFASVVHTLLVDAHCVRLLTLHTQRRNGNFGCSDWEVREVRLEVLDAHLHIVYCCSFYAYEDSWDVFTFLGVGILSDALIAVYAFVVSDVYSLSADSS